MYFDFGEERRYCECGLELIDGECLCGYADYDDYSEESMP